MSIPSGMFVVMYDLDKDGSELKWDLLGRTWIDFKRDKPKYNLTLKGVDNGDVKYYIFNIIL